MTGIKEQKRRLKMKQLVKQFREAQKKQESREDALLRAGRIEIGIVK